MTGKELGEHTYFPQRQATPKKENWEIYFKGGYVRICLPTKSNLSVRYHC